MFGGGDYLPIAGIQTAATILCQGGPRKKTQLAIGESTLLKTSGWEALMPAVVYRHTHD